MTTVEKIAVYEQKQARQFAALAAEEFVNMQFADTGAQVILYDRAYNSACLYQRLAAECAASARKWLLA